MLVAEAGNDLMEANPKPKHTYKNKRVLITFIFIALYEGRQEVWVRFPRIAIHPVHDVGSEYMLRYMPGRTVARVSTAGDCLCLLLRVLNQAPYLVVEAIMTSLLIG